MSFPTKKLKEISVIRTGKLDSNAAVQDGLYPFFTCDPQTLSINEWAYDTEAVLLAGNNASGNYTAKYYSGKFNAYQRTYIIETADKNILNVRFLCYALNQQLKLLKTMSSGSTTKFLTIRMLHDLDIPFPDITIQNRIVGVLGTIDDLIENNQKQINLLEEAAQRLYKEWFIDLRFPGHESTSIVNGLPEGWEKGKIINYFTTVLGGTPSRANKEYWGGNIRWINSGEVNKLRIIKESEFISELGLKKSATKLMPVHTTVLAITGATLGQVSYTEIETCANQSVVGIYDQQKVYSEYIYLAVSNEIKSIISKATGGAQQHNNKDIVTSFEIMLPSADANDQFKAIISPLFTKITDCYITIEKLSEARDRLLPKLMNGELEVNNAAYHS